METDDFCVNSAAQDRLCWISVLTDPKTDINRVQDDITICHECGKFKTLSERGTGRRVADQAIGLTIMKLMEQLAFKKENLEKTAIELKKTVEQLSLIKNITDAIARSDSLEKSLRIILTGATSGDAYGFNRAAVFLVNDKTNMLEARCAIGPDNLQEAIQIWNKIANASLGQLLNEILSETEFIPCNLELSISAFKIALNEKNQPLVQVLDEAKEQVVNVKAEKFAKYDWTWWPGASTAVAVPLISEGRPLGLIWADNAVTSRPITGDLIESLRALANACAPGLENAMLQQKLKNQLQELERIHALLKSNQAYLVQHERLVDIGMLATKVAHEFKIPLVTIGGYARRIKNTINTDKFDKKTIDVIISEVDRLMKINSEILEYSRIARLNVQECDVNHIIDDSLSQMQDRFKASGIKAECRYTKPSLMLKADPERLKQVILNLVDNAVEAMNNGGKLMVKTTKLNDYVVLEIADTGAGLDKEGIDNLFKLFYTTKTHGCGLGLPVTKKIVDDHGGHINVSSAPGIGTVFSVHLPANENEHDLGKQ
jgi:signal transduction histidine kinase